MIKLFDNGAYLLNGTELVEDNVDANAILTQKLGTAPSKEEAAKNTMAYGILEKHNTSDNMDNLKIKFDKMTSHDITFVGIIQTARASGLKEFPILMSLQTVTTPYVQLVVRSMRMTTCLVFPAQRNSVVSMFRLTRLLSISSQEKCLPAVEQ